MPDYFPPNAPTVNNGTISIEMWLANPARVERTIRNLANERFLADRIFSTGPAATGGAVIYDQVLASDLYALRDIQSIEPGSEFPIVVGGETSPLVARAIKWGGAALLTYEERDRDRRDQLGRKLTRLRNTIIRKVDAVAIATLRAAPILQMTASSSWELSNSAIHRDLATGISVVDRQDLGYNITQGLISPTTALNLKTNDKLINQLPREGGGGLPINPLLARSLAGVGGIQDWYVTNRVADGEVILTSGQQAGSISDEKPLYSRVVDDPLKERAVIMAGRLTVPYVTDPKSVIRISGV